MTTHEVNIREDSGRWIRQHSGAIFAPEMNLPDFHSYNSGNTQEEFEYYEYEDLVFLPVIAYFLSDLPQFSGPKLQVLLNEFHSRAESFATDLKASQELGRSFPYLHQVGISLDREDAENIHDYLEIAQRRAARVAEIFQRDFSSPESTTAIADSLNDQELVDIYIFGILAEEGFPTLDPPEWALEQVQTALKYADDLLTAEGPDLTYGQIVDGVPEFMHDPHFLGSIDDYPLFLLVSKESNQPAELVCNNHTYNFLRVAGKWGAMPASPSWKANYTWHTIKRDPPVKYELIHLWDKGNRQDINLGTFVNPTVIPSASPSQAPVAKPTNYSSPLTDEERELFFAVWSETMPEVLNWSDEEILYGMSIGM